jgi:hypothetical protein
VNLPPKWRRDFEQILLSGGRHSSVQNDWVPKKIVQNPVLKTALITTLGPKTARN